jgi:hypothetical protein
MSISSYYCSVFLSTVIPGDPNYLQRWVAWWVNASNTWEYQELLQWFLDVCWQKSVAAYAASLCQLHLNKLHTEFSLLGVAA